MYILHLGQFQRDQVLLSITKGGFHWGTLYGVCHITFPIWSITEPGWLKPKLADYEIEVLLPRPKKNIQDEQDEDEAENSVHGSQSGGRLADD
jgi:hypothetical protein